jgi:hypothetical protein
MPITRAKSIKVAHFYIRGFAESVFKATGADQKFARKGSATAAPLGLKTLSVMTPSGLCRPPSPE